MGKLEAAGFWGQMISSFFPKRLEVEVQTETLPDGNIQVVPRYTIDGLEVTPDLIAPSHSQTILGYQVTAGKDAIAVLQETGGKKTRLSKRKAASFIGQMSQRGVKLRTKGKNTPTQLTVVRPEIRLELNADDSLRVSSQLVTPQGVVVEKPPSLVALKQEDGWFLANGDLCKVDLTGSPRDELVLTGTELGHLSGDDVPRFIRYVDQNRSQFAAVEKSDNLEGLSIYGDQYENRVRVTGDGEVIRLDPALVYFGKDKQPYQSTPAGQSQALAKGGGFSRIPEGWIEVTREVVQKHEEAVAELSDKVGALDDIRGDEIPRTLSMLRERDLLKSPWAVYFSDEVKNSHRLVTTPADSRFTLNVVESDGRALLELDPRYNHERFRLTHEEIREALHADEEWIRRGDAWVKIDRERFTKVQEAILCNGLEQTPTGFRFQASRREEVIQVFSLLGSIQYGETYARFLEQLADFEKIDVADLPRSLRPSIQLRPYQQHGYNWLAFLRRYGLNGILADDMGLGKTLQTLAVVRMEQERTGSPLPSLVICPTSLVTNWMQEANKFFTGFKVRSYTGANRAGVLREIQGNSSSLFDSDGAPMRRSGNFVVVTSFGVALRDQQALSRIPWLYVIVDEAHQIKNPSAQRSRAIKTINGQYKLALIGTPIQNNLDELWSLFDFVMPGYLGSRGRFRDQYGKGRQVNWAAVHDEKNGLKKRIYPFVLRRLKEDVAQDLPEKVQIKLPVELTAAQVKLYKEVLKSAEFKKLVAAIDAQGGRQSSVQILKIYTQLRNICNHPDLEGPGPYESARAKDSGKLEALRELMEEVREGGHRALVFCQSTRMLDIIGRFFKEWKLEFLRLDGSTAPSTRQELVDEFNGDQRLTAFLISTKAGGTGLNLTSADTVIFYDHDWNPANDRQAQDRAYRIGQTRNVTVYRLVSVGTIEEKIIERQELKQTLADEIVGADEGFKDLTKEQLISLFQFDG